MATDEASASDDVLVLPSELTRLVDAREWVAARATKAGFEERAVWELELAVTEAVSNVIRHGYAGEPGHEVHLSVEVDEDKLTVIVRGFGKGFDRAGYRAQERDPSRPGGYGVGLIEQVMDEVEWDAGPARGTRLRMAKYRTSSKEMVDGDGG